MKLNETPKWNEHETNKQKNKKWNCFSYNNILNMFFCYSFNII